MFSRRMLAVRFPIIAICKTLMISPPSMPKTAAPRINLRRLEFGAFLNPIPGLGVGVNFGAQSRDTFIRGGIEAVIEQHLVPMTLCQWKLEVSFFFA